MIKSLLIAFFLLQGTAQAGFLLNCETACGACRDAGGICVFCDEEKQKIYCKKLTPRPGRLVHPESEGRCTMSNIAECVDVVEGAPCMFPWITPMPGQCTQTDPENETCDCQPISPY